MHYFTSIEWVYKIEHDGKNMSFLIKDDKVWDKYGMFGMLLKINWTLNFIANLFMNINN